MRTNLALYILLFFLLANSLATAQNLSIRVRSGFGFYQMEDMKTIQNQFASNYEFLKVTDDFPPYINFQTQLVYSFKEDYFTIGLLGGFSSTGGKKTASDYSGEMYLKQFLKSYQIGILFENKTYTHNLLSIYLGTQISGHYSVFKYLINDTIGFHGSSPYGEEEAEFNSMDLSIEPYIAFALDILPVDLRFEAGYNKFFPSDLKLVDHKEVKLGSKADWSGLRISFLVGYRI